MFEFKFYYIQSCYHGYESRLLSLRIKYDKQ